MDVSDCCGASRLAHIAHGCGQSTALGQQMLPDRRKIGQLQRVRVRRCWQLVASDLYDSEKWRLQTTWRSATILPNQWNRTSVVRFAWIDKRWIVNGIVFQWNAIAARSQQIGRQGEFLRWSRYRIDLQSANTPLQLGQPSSNADSQVLSTEIYLSNRTWHSLRYASRRTWNFKPEIIGELE